MINELGATPTTYPTDLLGTCYDEYAGQKYISFNFWEHYQNAITGTMDALNYDIIDSIATKWINESAGSEQILIVLNLYFMNAIDRTSF